MTHLKEAFMRYLRCVLLCIVRPYRFQLWSRYFFFRFLKQTAFAIIFVYILFIFADMIGHIKDIVDPKTSIRVWVSYYACMLSRRLDVFVPFSCGIAAILVLVKATSENTIVPLLSSGLSLKRFIRPFAMVALFYSSLLWINFEFFYPAALRTHVATIETDFGRKEKSKNKENSIGVIMLGHGQRLFFNRHIPDKIMLYDVFWFISRNTVCHIEELYYSKYNLDPPEGHHVEYYQRNDEGIFTKESSYYKKVLDDLTLSEQQIAIATAQPKEIAISDLYTISLCYGLSKTERANEIKIALYIKLFTPLLTFLAITTACATCLSFNRRSYSITKPLLIVIVALFCAQIIIQMFTVLARSPFIPTEFVLFLPWILFFCICIRQLQKIF